MGEYPDRRSTVSVTFIDGEVKTYTVDAGPSISPYLCEQSASTGTLCLLDRESRKSHNIPVAQIREWAMTELKIGEA